MTIKKYWNLIDWEPFLGVIWEPGFSQACNFCRMLMNHKNFYFTQISDKTNDRTFLKSPKTMFLGHLWPFLVIFARCGFLQSGAVTHNYLWTPQQHAKFQKKLMSQFRENLRTDGRTGQTLFYRTLQTAAGVQLGKNLWNILYNNLARTHYKLLGKKIYRTNIV